MKTVDDVLCKMRYGVIPKHRHDRELLMHFADRIEAAAKALEADRDNWRRQALDEDARANATHKDSLVVGDMAAMREAFEEMLAWYNELHDDVAAMDAAMEKARAALAKPPRNCDRFVDELDAQIEFLNDVWLISVTKDTMLERDKFENWTEEMKSRYAKWLFAEAKGEQK